MPAYRVSLKSEFADQAIDVWEFDEELACALAADLLAEDSLVNRADMTAVPVEPSFLPLNQAWRVGDWIACPWAIVRAEYARAMSKWDLNDTPPSESVERIIHFLETGARPWPLEPVGIRLGYRWLWAVVLQDHTNPREQLVLDIRYWLPAFERGLDVAGLLNYTEFPSKAPIGPLQTSLLLDDGRVVGAVMSLEPGSDYWTLWESIWDDPR